ncbi:MAG TPA: hypothetical protein VK457_01100 [Chloroflexota bacterium]|nr:hypothetical protein [Chloroflexota bacterium]
MERWTVPVLVVLGGLLIIWYLAGNELMRRRAQRLALWCKKAADGMGSKQAVKWYTLHSFRLDVEPAGSFRSAALTGLTESWDVPLIWLWNRLNWRRDMVLAQLTLDKQPLWGLELYRPRAVLAGDAQHAARTEGWDEEALEEFRLAPANDANRKLGLELLANLGEQRQHLIRLSVRRRETHLSLALNVPQPDSWPPEEFHALLERMTATVLSSAASAA